MDVAEKRQVHIQTHTHEHFEHDQKTGCVLERQAVWQEGNKKNMMIKRKNKLLECFLSLSFSLAVEVGENGLVFFSWGTR